MTDASLEAKIRRDALTAQGRCFNGSNHGPPTHGRRCAWCHSVHRIGLMATVKAHEQTGTPERPPGHKIQTRGQ